MRTAFHSVGATDTLGDAHYRDGGSFDVSLAHVQLILSEQFGRRNIRVYEAGGGSMTYLPQFSVHSQTVAVDIDERQLLENSYADFRVRGDIQTALFRPNSFDLIVCYNVLEHVERPDKVIQNFFEALATGGFLFIAGPNPHSFFGAVTRFSPHWFHVWVYRTFLGHIHAGEPGKGPFPVVYHALASPRRLAQFCQALGFEVTYYQEFEAVQFVALQRTHKIIAGILRIFVYVSEFLFRKNLRNGDFHLLLKKP